MDGIALRTAVDGQSFAKLAVDCRSRCRGGRSTYCTGSICWTYNPCCGGAGILSRIIESLLK